MMFIKYVSMFFFHSAQDHVCTAETDADVDEMGFWLGDWLKTLKTLQAPQMNCAVLFLEDRVGIEISAEEPKVLRYTNMTINSWEKASNCRDDILRFVKFLSGRQIDLDVCINIWCKMRGL